MIERGHGKVSWGTMPSDSIVVEIVRREILGCGIASKRKLRGMILQGGGLVGVISILMIFSRQRL